jgi:hypothetical protein
MVQVTDSLAAADTTCNAADPIQALADTWGSIKQIDRAQRELDQGEKAAHEQKNRLEQTVLSLEPQPATPCRCFCSCSTGFTRMMGSSISRAPCRQSLGGSYVAAVKVAL